MRELFRDGDFTAYFIGRQFGSLSYRIESVAIGWQVFLIRHQPFDLGLVGLVMFLPSVIFALPAGFIADRFDRRAVCIAGFAGEAAGMTIFASLALLGTRSLGVYLMAAGLLATAHALVSPSDSSLLATIFRGNAFMRAQAFASSIRQLIAIAGPALAGLLLVAGAPIAFGTGAAGYAVAALAYAALSPRGTADHAASILHDALEGLRFIARERVVLGAITLDLFAVLFGGATALMPVFANSILRVGPVGLGLLDSAPAVGGALVAFALARRPLERRIGAVLFATVAGFGIATIAFGLSRSFGVTLVALAAVGAFDMVSVVIRSGLVQLQTPDAMRGRVTAVEQVFIGASNELGAFESGTVAAFAGTQMSVVLGGAATLCVVAASAVCFPALRRFDRFTPLEGELAAAAPAPIEMPV